VGTTGNPANEYVGRSGSGAFTQNGGTHTVIGDLVLANTAGSTGSYVLNGGTLTVGTTNTIHNESIGYRGTGTFIQTGGTHIINGSLYMSYASGASASYVLGGGDLLVTTTAGTASESIPVIGTATFTQTGGTNTVNGTLSLGTGNDRNGSYLLSAGTLTVNTSGGTGYEYIGDVTGTGTFRQTGGTHILSGNMVLAGGAVPGDRGVYRLYGGTLNVTGTISGGGKLIYEGGSLSAGSITAPVYMGYDAATSTTMTLDGALNLSTTGFCVGYSGTATVTQTGGSYAPKYLSVGSQAGSTGSYTLAGGTLSTAGTTVGSSGAGSITQTGGVHTVSGSLYLGADSGGSGSYLLVDGSLSVLGTGGEYIGYDGSGTFTQSGGTHSVTSKLNADNYALSGGTLVVGTPGGMANEHVWNSFNQTGGLHQVFGTLYLEMGSYTLSGGTLSVTTTGGTAEHVGYDGAFVFTQSGGVHSVTGSLDVRWSPYIMYAGSLDVTGSIIGHVPLVYEGGAITAGDLNCPLSLPHGATLNRTGTGPVTIGLATVADTVTKTGSGTIVLTGSSLYTGETVIAEGTLVITNTGGLGAPEAGTTVADGAALAIQTTYTTAPAFAEPLTIRGSGVGGSGALRNASGYNAWNGDITLAAPATIGVEAGSLTINGPMHGTGRSLTKVGEGTLALAGSGATYGDTYVQAGFLKLNAPDVLPAGSTLNVADGAVVLAGGSPQNVSRVAGAGNIVMVAPLAVGGGGASMEFTGSLRGGQLVKTGSGKITLCGPSTYSGGTTLDGGTLAISGGGRPEIQGVDISLNVHGWFDTGEFLWNVPIDSNWTRTGQIGPDLWRYRIEDRGYIVERTGDWTWADDWDDIDLQVQFADGVPQTLQINACVTRSFTYDLLVNGEVVVQHVENHAGQVVTLPAPAGPGAFTSGPLGIAALTVQQGTVVAEGGPRTLRNAVVAEGDFTVAGDHNLTLSGPLSITAGRTLTKVGPASLTIAGPQSHDPGATLAIREGAVNLDSSGGDNAGRNLAVTVEGGAVLTVGATQYLAGLSMTGSARASINAVGSGVQSRTIKTDALAIDSTSLLDLGDNNLIVNYTGGGAATLQSLMSLIKSGRGTMGGDGRYDWNGAAGITSSAVAAGDRYLGLGIRDFGFDLTNRPAPAMLEGVEIESSTDGGPASVAVMYTWMGDMDLDGKVTVNDYLEFLHYYAENPPSEYVTWMTGDFNYDGLINVNDYLLLLAGYANQDGSLGAGEPVTALAAVPEPATLAMLAVGGALVALRRRRRGIAG
jgi:fibronectin-binding autotransporter adhesin